MKTEHNVHELKEKVKRMLVAPVLKKPTKILDFIDEVQRLGISRHFKNEIEEILQQIHKNSYGGDEEENDDDLHTTSLRFRLLRQQGYKVSCGESSLHRHACMVNLFYISGFISS